MQNGSNLTVLLVAEGSGGHLIPALQVAETLAKSGARIAVWYAQRRQTAPLADALTEISLRKISQLDVRPIPVESSTGVLGRLRHCGHLWRDAQRCFDAFKPDVVMGFGGWMSAPVVLAACLRRGFGRQARRRRIGCLVHEQNVLLGRTNRWLAPWVDRVAVSFQETQASLRGAPSVMTGLPVRDRIGRLSRSEAALRFALDPERPTLVVLGGSQGSRALNRLMPSVAALLSPSERARWQVIHVAGVADGTAVREAYTAHQVRAQVASCLVDMEAAYAHADLVIARAGASTIAELARCATPAILIPYPHAGGHQRANARVAEAIGGAVMIEERDATPERVLGSARRILADTRLRAMMGQAMRQLFRPDAAERITGAIIDVARISSSRAHDEHPKALIEDGGK